MTGKLSKNFHGVGIGPLSKILAVNSDKVCSGRATFGGDRGLIFCADHVIASICDALKQKVRSKNGSLCSFKHTDLRIQM